MLAPREKLKDALLRDCRLVVIGGSAGSLDALGLLLGELPSNFRLPILISLHVHHSDSGSVLRHIQRFSPLPVARAEDGLPVLPGRIFIAPASRHLAVTGEGVMSLSDGDEVNGARPAIDVLFQSVARPLGARLISVLLSGASDDGVRGAVDVVLQGGLSIIQDPSTALATVMPQTAVDAGGASMVLTPKAIGRCLMLLDKESQERERVRSAIN